MKIERISENQIRCTLNKEDLAEKEILLTELAYGTEKAKSLFRDMMQQASTELGFEVDEMPLMIEAIPVNPDCLILIITKVENPDELDTRFSRFTRSVSGAQDEEDYEEDEDDDASDDETVDAVQQQREGIPPEAEGLIEAIGNLAEEISASLPKGLSQKMKSAVSETQEKTALYMVFVFRNLNEVILSSKLVSEIYDSENTLYKNPEDSKFYLYLKRNNNTETEFIKACNIISEYALPCRATYASAAYFDEHFKVIRRLDALQTLAAL